MHAGNLIPPITLLSLILKTVEEVMGGGGGDEKGLAPEWPTASEMGALVTVTVAFREHVLPVT